MTLQQVAKALHGTVNGRWINIPGPGHNSTDKSLGFKFDKAAPDGFHVNSFAGDDPNECREWVKHLLCALRHDGTLPASSSIEEDASCDAPRRPAVLIWTFAAPPAGTLVETYLESRGCGLPPSGIRFHPNCPFGKYRFPAMLGLMQHILTNEPTGIHRTAIADSGCGKREMPAGLGAKMMLGQARGAAVKLAPHEGCLGIAEGIETALTASSLFEIPVWAALSASGIASFPLVPGVEKITVFADHDGAGLSAARKCAERYQQAGVPGCIAYLDQINSDWNDAVWNGE